MTSLVGSQPYGMPSGVAYWVACGSLTSMALWHTITCEAAHNAHLIKERASMDEMTGRVVALHDQLIEMYDSNDMSKQARTEYSAMLKQYASTVALVATRALMELLGIDANVELLQLTAKQYGQLEASDMLDVYIDGKEDTDD